MGSKTVKDGHYRMVDGPIQVGDGRNTQPPKGQEITITTFIVKNKKQPRLINMTTCTKSNQSPVALAVHVVSDWPMNSPMPLKNQKIPTIQHGWAMSPEKYEEWISYILSKKSDKSFEYEIITGILKD